MNQPRFIVSKTGVIKDLQLPIPVTPKQDTSNIKGFDAAFRNIFGTSKNSEDVRPIV